LSSGSLLENDLETNAVCIDVSDLRKTYSFGKVIALDGVSLKINQGEVFGLIGPNGAGKTTLMGCLLALLKPTSGEIKIDGFAPDAFSTRAITGFLPERPTFDSWMTARQFLSYHHMLAKRPAHLAKAEIEEALDLVSLEAAARGRQVKKFSRGMLQRLGLAQVLIGKPKICFLDEPTSGMDPIGMAMVRDLLLRWKEENVTVIVNSHHLDEVEKVCDRVAFIRSGRIENLESLGAQVNKRHCFVVKLKATQSLESNIDRLRLAAQESAAEFIDCNDAIARFSMVERENSALLIKALVEHDIAFGEASFEKQDLIDLFLAKEGRKSE
jgi:ABC-2 type transport system ATP-binding protein